MLDGLVNKIQWHQIAFLNYDETCLIDVRSGSERDRGFIPGSIHIPLPQLRMRLPEVPLDKNIVTYCQSGQRSYNASRLLKQNGFSVKNLSGRYVTWNMMQPAGSEMSDQPSTPAAAR